MVDETKPPSRFWRYDEKAECWYLEYASKSFGGAHRFAREEAAPYVAEALERIAVWLETMHANREHIGRDLFVERLREMARGERPLPGSEGGT